MTDVSGWIVAPDTDNDGLYDKDVDCLWKIKAPLQQVIRFEVAFAGIEHSNDCVKDMLIVSCQSFVSLRGMDTFAMETAILTK